MKFSVENNDLNKALSVVSKAISYKTSLPILECVYICTNENSIILKGTDTEISVITTIPANIYIKGEVVIPIKSLLDLIRTYPDDIIHFDMDEHFVINIKCSKSDVSMIGKDATQFPEIKKYDLDKFINVKTDLIRDLIKDTVFACSPGVSINPVLTGVNIELKKDSITFTALDGFKMANRKEVINNTAYEDTSAIIHGRILSEVLKILSTYDNDANIAFSDKKMIIDLQDTQIIANQLEGVYIKYETLLPKEINTVIKINKDDLLTCVSRASLLTDDSRNSLVKFSIEDDILILSSRSERGKVKEEISVYKNGEDINIAFNARYFVEVLKIISDEKVLIEFKDNSTAGIIKPVDSNKFLYLVMPVRYID